MRVSLDTNNNVIKVRVQLDEDAPDLVFTVCADAVRAKGDDIRATLNKLNEYAARNPTFSADRDPDLKDYNDILIELKGKGQELYLYLFRPPTRSAESARRLETEILKLPRGANLSVHCSGEGLTFPLGFLCDPGVEIEDTNVRMPSRADFDDMWINRFDITWLLDGCRCNAHQQAIDPASFRSLFALHQQASDDAIAELLERSHDGYFDKYQALIGLDVGSYKEWRDARKAYASMADFDAVFFIFAHAETGEKGSKLFLGPDPKAEMGSSKLADLLQQRGKNDKSALLILNCCASVTSDDSGSFLSAVAAAVGFCGVVGTEAEILNTAALRCGVHLMWELCFQARSLGDAFRSMQAAPELFPHNLLYSCYASRKFRLDKPLTARSRDEPARAAGAPVA